MSDTPCLILEGDQPCAIEVRRGLLCELHRNRLYHCLRDIPGHAVDVLAAQGRSTTPSSELVSGSRDGPLPAALWLEVVGPTAERGEPDPLVHPTVLDVLQAWVRMISEERGITHPRLSRDLQGLSIVCGWLAGCVDWTVTQPWCDEMYAEVTEQWRRVRTAAHDQPSPRRGVVPCVACGIRALVQQEPLEEYRCLPSLGGCGHRETEATHEQRIMDTDRAITRTRARRAS